VSSGEKNAVKLNGGRNDRSLPASLSREGRGEDDGDGRPNSNGNVYPYVGGKEGLTSCKRGE